MYEVSKISPNSWNPDNTPIYEYTLKFRTWKELIKDLQERDNSHNSIFYGKGANLFKDDVLIGNINCFRIDKPIYKITLKEFKEECE